MPESCSEVFHFPPREAAMTSPSLMAMVRRPLIKSSRARMITTTHDGTRPRRSRITSAESTMILSASGSRNFPRVVTLFDTRASHPSIQSEIAAAANTAAARKLLRRFS